MSHAQPDVVTIFVDVPGVADIAPLPNVGTIYEIAINGVGFMLDDHPEERERQYQSIMPSLDPPRFAATDTPFDQAIERYAFATANDWSVGAGQRWLNREESTAGAYWRSRGVDTLTEQNQVTLLHTTEEILDTELASTKMVVVGDRLFVLSDVDELSYTENGVAWSTIDLDGFEPIDLASDGEWWYATDGTEILRGQITPPSSAWSEIAADRIDYLGGRIVAAVGSTFTTLAPDGTEELEDGHRTLNDDEEILFGGVAGGYLYFASRAGSRGRIWAWPLGVDQGGNFFVPFVALELPAGTVPAGLATEGGSVFVKAVQPSGPDPGARFLYRAVPDQNGSLTPFLVAELGTDDLECEGHWAARGNLVFFGWCHMHDDASGVGAASLATGGYAPWVEVPDGHLAGVEIWQGRLVIADTTGKIWLEDHDSYVEEGWVEDSVADGASLLRKVWDDVTVEVNSLSSGQSVKLEITTDGGGSYSEVGEMAAAGARRAVFRLDRRATSLGTRTTLLGPGDSTPTLTFSQRRYHALGLADRVVVVPVKCYDNVLGLNGAPLPENQVGTGARNARLLESMAQSRVLFQDVDWHLTGQAEVMEIIGVARSRSFLVYDEKTGQQSVGFTVEVTLRKSTS